MTRMATDIAPAGFEPAFHDSKGRRAASCTTGHRGLSTYLKTVPLINEATVQPKNKTPTPKRPDPDTLWAEAVAAIEEVHPKLEAVLNRDRERVEHAEARKQSQSWKPRTGDPPR